MARFLCGGVPQDYTINAKVENEATASQAYSQGEYVVRKKVLREVIAPIARGDALVIGTNLSSNGTNVMAETTKLKRKLTAEDGTVFQFGTKNGAYGFYVEFMGVPVFYPFAKASGNDYEWPEVKAMVDAGVVEQYISTGDKFMVQLSTGEVLRFTAVVNNYELGEVDFIADWLLMEYRAMYAQNYNQGSWEGSQIRNWLNSSFFSQLPTDLQMAITPKTLHIAKAYGSTEIIETQDKIWLPSEWEVYGGTGYAAATEAPFYKQYPIFANAADRVRKQGEKGNAFHWWNASPYAGTYYYWSGDNTAGTWTYFNSSYAYGVLPCFRIAPAV